ncbi:HalOD1 output domain-containing protein [Natrinema halophilum]|uniref:Halobacterial output domain-containing protein n=1 Tax=Natrinema halophilum TaxID=1699371 RepID=A0A7D5KLG8_9EURY|nr:HalOD1 output domain-containing protein [Natrinema halophilum]QLG49918.1 hypothetical protein HYG82_14165 [Natrinema halophilum]
MPSTNDSTDETESQPVRCIATFDPADERASEAVVTAVAAVLGEDPGNLRPLYEHVDPDALDSLIENAQLTDSGTHQVWFPYEGVDVGVRSGGEIRVRDATVDRSR